ncbi:hypothetical protein ABTM76_19210, partial [Acinetobacter baumannii]
MRDSPLPNLVLPDLLAGAVSAADWWQVRRPALLALFEAEVFGSMPGRPAGFAVETVDEAPAL